VCDVVENVRQLYGGSVVYGNFVLYVLEVDMEVI